MRVLSLVAVLFSALVLAGSSSAAPPPGDPADPYTNYLLTRVLPNGSEKVLGAFLVTSWDEQEQLIRAVAFDAARSNRTNNSSWTLILYGPIDPPSTYWTDRDRIWTSAQE